MPAGHRVAYPHTRSLPTGLLRPTGRPEATRRPTGRLPAGSLVKPRVVFFAVTQDLNLSQNELMEKLGPHLMCCGSKRARNLVLSFWASASPKP